MEVSALVLGGYGINADAELAVIFERAGARSRRMHISDLIADPGLLSRTSILAFPGGFSYGDHLGSGQVLALLCRDRLRDALRKFVADGGLVIGICNGFQVLVRMGMLPNREGNWRREVSLIHNESGRFVDTWVRLRFERNSRCVWTRSLEDIEYPIRHGEGRFIAGDEATLDTLEAEGLIAVRYLGHNPNGSSRDIAGICDPSGRVFGLMPHPECFLEPENHPDRRRTAIRETGLRLFENGVAAARESR